MARIAPRSLKLVTAALALASARMAGAEEPAAPAANTEEPAAAPTEAQPSETEQAPESTTGGPGLFEQSTMAAAAAGTSMDSATSPFQLSGYVRGDIYAGKVIGENKGDIKAGYGEASIAIKTKKSSVGDGYAELRLRYGMQGEAEQETSLSVREAYVNTYVGPVDVRLGKQIIVWGRADMLNPTNNITPNDLRARSPIEDDRRLGNLGARAFLRLSPIRLEGVWMPLYAATQLPVISLPQYVSYTDPAYPKPLLTEGLLAGRVHLELPSIEMSVSYLHGYAPLPGLTLNKVRSDDVAPYVLLARTAYKQQVVGFDFSTAVGDLFALRGEAAYRRPYDYQNLINAPRPDLQYALGADHSFGSVSVIVQYLGRYAFDWKKQEGPLMSLDSSELLTQHSASLDQSAQDSINSLLAKTNQILFGQTEQIQHLATVRVEWLGAHDTLSLSALGMVNFTTKEWLASPRVGYHISDSLMLYVGAEILTGPKDTLFGMVDQQMSAGYAELRSTF